MILNESEANENIEKVIHQNVIAYHVHHVGIFTLLTTSNNIPENSFYIHI